MTYPSETLDQVLPSDAFDPSTNPPVTIEHLDDGSFHVLSHYQDNVWRLPDAMFPSNVQSNQKKLKFDLIPEPFREVVKQVILYLYTEGLEGRKRLTGNSLSSYFRYISYFLEFIDHHYQLPRLCDITPLHCSQYVQYQKARKSKTNTSALSVNFLKMLFHAVETLYHVSQFTNDPMTYPWPDNSASFLAGIDKVNDLSAKTPIIPDDILSPLFQAAVRYIDKADALLTLRDQAETWRGEIQGSEEIKQKYIRDHIKTQGSLDNLRKLNDEVSYLQTACMIVIFTTTGIRNHELAWIQKDSCHLIMDDGNKYYWLKSRSDKTGAGWTEWLATELTHKAIKIAERVTEPIRKKLQKEINQTAKNTYSINKLERHQQAIFLGQRTAKTLSDINIDDKLKKFIKHIGLDWPISSHQFRRTFAVYVAKSAYGDLRYLREHFKHWGMDMTVLYAMNEQQDHELYDEIHAAMIDEKIAIVEHWLDKETLITGGASEGIVTFRNQNEAVNTKESRREMAETIAEHIYIRATGAAWCTADDGGCRGITATDKTRCGNCKNAVIDDRKARYWQGIYQQQQELIEIKDIGEDGQARAQRDLERCESVLTDLGVDLSAVKAEGQPS